jgi:hypothetical protein
VELVQSLINFLDSRLKIDKGQKGNSYACLLKALSPECLLAAAASEKDIKNAYDTIVPDQEWKDFYASYGEMVDFLKGKVRSTTLRDILCLTLNNEEWSSLSIALARLLVAKPHSCDVERLVSAYNLFKDDDRCSLFSETLHAYLHVHTNMPPLADFNVHPALHDWMTIQRRSCETKKAVEQEWFSDVFTTKRS